jgi:hypothetical protein
MSLPAERAAGELSLPHSMRSSSLSEVAGSGFTAGGACQLSARLALAERTIVRSMGVARLARNRRPVTALGPYPGAVHPVRAVCPGKGSPSAAAGGLVFAVQTVPSDAAWCSGVRSGMRLGWTLSEPKRSVDDDRPGLPIRIFRRAIKRGNPVVAEVQKRLMSRIVAIVQPTRLAGTVPGTKTRGRMHGRGFSGLFDRRPRRVFDHECVVHEPVLLRLIGR